MVNPFSFLFAKRMLGIDIGTSSIKIVELSLRGKNKKLENYGEMRLALPQESKAPGKVLPSGVAVSRMRQILGEANIKTKSAVLSIPDFLTFSTSFEIPKMPDKEVAGAVTFNAAQYVTLPMSEVTLDWKVISGASNANSMKVFIVAIPNQVIRDYQAIAKGVGLELYALEAEVFGLVKALVRNTIKTICLLDLGEQSSTINIIDQGALKRSYSSTFSASQLTGALSSVLKLTPLQAEDIKNKEGMSSVKPEVLKTTTPFIDQLLEQVKSVSDDFFKSDKKNVEEVYLTGGTANLIGLKEYVAKNLQKPVTIPDCFADIARPIALGEALREMNGRFSVAVGMAQDGLEI